MFRTVGSLLGRSGSRLVPACGGRGLIYGAEEEVFSPQKLHFGTAGPQKSSRMPAKKVCIVGSGNW